MHETRLIVIEDENGCKFWEFTGKLDKDEFFGKHPEALEAIIKSGWSSTRNGASQVAKELGYDFNP